MAKSKSHLEHTQLKYVPKANIQSEKVQVVIMEEEAEPVPTQIAKSRSEWKRKHKPQESGVKRYVLKDKSTKNMSGLLGEPSKVEEGELGRTTEE